MNMEKHAKKFLKSAKSNLSKAKRTYVCRSLKDLIKAYRACTTRSEERALVKKEAAHIRDLFREGDKTFRRRNISKLLFFHMNGYPTDFGMTECIKLCASHEYSDKRVAYLGLMILVDETEEVLMLMTNSLKQDLNSHDVQIISLALNVLGDIANVEMVRDLLPEIENHLHSSNPHIRKKAALAAVRAVRKLGYEETQNIAEAVPVIFDMRSSAVHVSASALISALCKQSIENVHSLQNSMTPIIVNILQEHLNARKGQSVIGSNPDTVINGVRNPFLQVKLIAVMRQLVERSSSSELLQDVSDALAQVASNTDSGKVAGCSVLYECVRTIIALKTEPSLRSLAVTILGRFLSHKEATVRYIALQELTRVADADGPEALVNIDQAKVISGMQEADPSVRKRALDLVYRIANEKTLSKVAKEILGYIEKSEHRDGIEDGCRKLFLLCDKYGPSEEWKVETFVRALGIADTSMPEQLITSFIAMVSAKPAVQGHTVALLFAEALSKPNVSHSVSPSEDIFEASARPSQENEVDGLSKISKRRPRLERVATYLLGEYGEKVETAGLGIPTVIDAFERVLEQCEVVDNPWMQPDGLEFSSEVKLLREVTLTGLVKFTCRVLAGSGHIGYGSEEPGFGMQPSFSEQTDVSAILGLPAPPQKSPVEDTGLGTELLASLGLGDGEPTKALVPSNPHQHQAEKGGAMALMSIDDMDSGAPVHPILLRVRRILQERTASPELEVQQRANEYLSLLQDENLPLCANAMAPMPKFDYETIRKRALDRETLKSSKSGLTDIRGEGMLLDLLDDPANGHSETLALPSPFENDLLALPAPAQAHKSDFNLEEILGTAGPSKEAHSTETQSSAVSSLLEMTQESLQTPVASHIANTDGARGNMLHTTIVEEENLRVTADFSRDDVGNPSTTRAELTFHNKSTHAMQAFVFLLSVPRYIELQMRPASSAEIPPGESASQSVILNNSLAGQRPIQLRYRVNYNFAGSVEKVQLEGMAMGLEDI